MRVRERRAQGQPERAPWAQQVPGLQERQELRLELRQDPHCRNHRSHLHRRLNLREGQRGLQAQTPRSRELRHVEQQPGHLKAHPRKGWLTSDLHVVPHWLAGRWRLRAVVRSHLRDEIPTKGYHRVRRYGLHQNPSCHRAGQEEAERRELH